MFLIQPLTVFLALAVPLQRFITGYDRVVSLSPVYIIIEFVSLEN
jgi:hypothetical protein